MHNHYISLYFVHSGCIICGNNIHEISSKTCMLLYIIDTNYTQCMSTDLRKHTQLRRKQMIHFNKYKTYKDITLSAFTVKVGLKKGSKAKRKQSLARVRNSSVFNNHKTKYLLALNKKSKTLQRISQHCILL